jgi:UV DNA damage endonuclease
MVFDYLHHTALTGHLPERKFLKDVCKSWSTTDGEPEFHYSTQKPGSRRGSHADMVDLRDFLRFLKVMPSKNVDLMLEAKAKDLALLRLRKQLWALGRASRAGLSPSSNELEHARVVEFINK